MAEQAMSNIDESMQQVRSAVGNAGDQVWSAAQDLGQKAREQTNIATDTLYRQGAAAGEYLARNVNAYPLTALLLAGAIGYGMGYLMHRGWQSAPE